MDAAQDKALREPFPPAQIGVLPKPYSKDSPKGKCQECGGYHGLPAVHLDYVGHAATTDRLRQVDRTWTWEPLAYDEQGLPAIDRAGNLWIKLTVAGVTRIGVGDGFSMKERIGDAIRNAAMRFGVALDLWAKEDLSANTTEPPPELTPEQRSEQAVAAARVDRANRNSQRRGSDTDKARARAWDASVELDDSLTQDQRRAKIVADVADRGWNDPQQLGAEHWTTLAEAYEQEADDATVARIIAQ